jgi:hypothetical protein
MPLSTFKNYSNHPLHPTPPHTLPSPKKEGNSLKKKEEWINSDQRVLGGGSERW